MLKRDGNIFRISFVVMIALLLALPIQALFAAGGSNEGAEINNSSNEGLIELTEDEVADLGLNSRSIPTRSEPWSIWERYSYHRGGEKGLVAYQISENRVFIYGGGSARWNNQGDYWSYSAYEDFFIFDFDTNKWYALEDCPPGGRFGFSYVIDEVNERFIIYGGFAGSMLNDLWEFDMNTLTWTQITSGLLGSAYNDRRAYASMILDTAGGVQDLYLLMGMEDQNTDYRPENKTDFYKIDLLNPTSITILNAGATDGFLPRYDQSMCFDQAGRRIYVFGGIHEDNNDNTYLDDFWMYDITSNLWTQLTTHPDMPMNIGAQIFFRNTDQKVYLWGGRENYTGSSYLEENETLWIYDPSIGSWDRFDYDDPGSDVPNGRMYYHHHYSSLADRFFVFGGRYYYYGYGGATSGRYRDLNYLTLSSKVWTQFPTISNPSTNSDGIFAHDEINGRLYYIGPNTAYNGTVYAYYWDLAEEKWYGPIYNSGTENPESRSNAGMAYDKKNNTVYMYGGTFTTGQGPGRQYWNRDDMWKWEINTNTWTQIWESVGEGPRHTFDMVWNENDGSLYFFGGRFYLEGGSSQSDSYDDFVRYKYGPTGGIFQDVLETSGTTNRPGPRYGAGTVYVPELNKLYLTCGRDPDPSKDYRDLWEFDFNTMKWTELQSLTSSMISPKLDYDPLTKELYLTGGDDYVIKRYRILEDAWYNMDPDINPGTLNGQSHIFLPETRDLWIYGGGAKDGIWKIGMPYRLSIQKIKFDNPQEGLRTAYAMLKPYKFSTEVKTVNGPSDLADVTMSFLHRDGTYKIIYNHTADSWRESDPNDVAEVTNLDTEWDGNSMTIEAEVLFHWNFSSRPNDVDKKVSVEARGINVGPDFLEVRNFLNVRNRIEIADEISLEGEIQGEISRGDWVQTFEPLTFSGPMVKYAGTTSVFPPADSYQMKLGEGRYVPNVDNILLKEVYRTWDLDVISGEPVEFDFAAPNRTYTNVTYILNVTGVYEDDEDLHKEYWLSVDGEVPLPPTTVIIHADRFDDTHTKFDNDMEVYLSWMSSGVSESGIFTHYWSLEDNGGTRDGNPVTGNEKIIELPSNGTHTVFMWTEDNVGNIGQSFNSSITIDTEIPVFEIVSPDLDQMIPYTELDVDVKVTDTGGSQLDSLTIRYRFTNDGLNSEAMWTGTNAWKDLSELWTDFAEDSMEFTMGLGKKSIPKLSDSEENFLQFRILDNAGNVKESPAYNIRVDTDLRFPMVTLYGPDENEVFTDPEDVELNWTLDFFLPEDVLYYLYIDKDRSLVENLDESIKIERVERFYNPLFVTHGTWYWTVVPIARNQWAGNATNGIKSFAVSQESSYSFEVTTPSEKLIRAYGTLGIPIDFNVENTGQNSAVLTLTYDIEGMGSFSWVGGPSFEVGVGETKAKIGTLDISEATPVGNYNLTFYFNSTFDVKRTITVLIQVIPPVADEKTEDEETDYGLYFIMAAILIILLLVVVAVIYFMVIKKGGEKKPVSDSTEELDRLEEEIAASGGGEGFRPVAPQPLGITSKTKGVDSGSLPDDVDDGQTHPAEVERTTLTEEGSEDDWMNLVAAETIAAENYADIVEDKTKHEDGKSLQDILSDMTSGVEED